LIDCLLDNQNRKYTMPLHPDLAAFLELVEAGVANGARRLHELPAAQARAEYDKSTLILDSEGVDTPSVKPVDIPGRNGDHITARLYMPVNPSHSGPKLPALLYFHGGGYCVGGLDSHDSLCRALTMLTPCCVLNVAYRLAPEHKFPGAVHDAQDAYQWLLSNGTGYGIDTQRVAVGGDSAGGTLATGLTMTARDSQWPQPLLQVLLYPCTAARQDSASHRRLAQGHLLEAVTLQWMFNNYLRNEADRTDWRFAPLEANDLSNLPPAFIALAEYDPLVDEGTEYASKLEDAGVPVQLKLYEGMTHDFARLGNIVNQAEAVRKDMAEALARAFQQSFSPSLSL
jgi:acetyl esterase